MTCKIFGGALALPLICIAGPALADEAPAPENRTIIVTGERSTDAAEALIAATPGGADVVGYEDYADKSLVSLRDALAFSPGVYLQPRYGQEVRLSVRGSGISRGFHMRGLTLLQDGIPINLADDNGDFQELEPAFFDHLEVYRGSNALRFGSGTLGGAINGVTPTGMDAAGLYLRGDAGTFDTVRGLASFGGVSGDVDYWAALSADSSDGDRQHADRKSARFHGNLGWQVSGNVTTRFYASLNTIRQKLPGALNLATVLSAPETGNFAGDQARDIDSLRLQNRTTVDLSDGKLAFGVFYNRKSLYHPIFQVIDQESTDFGAFARFDYESGPLAFTLGSEIRRGSTRAQQYVNLNGKRGDLRFDADQDARSLSLYGELRYTPIERLTLIAGGVYASGWRAREVLYSFTPAQDGRIEFDEFSPKFGVLVDAGGGIQVYANYSRSAEFPGFGEVFQTVAGTSTFIPSIAPQTAWTIEAGTRGSSGIASWDFTLYSSRIDGELLQYNVGPDIPASTFNAGNTLHQGIEAALSLQLADWAVLRQVYQYSKFRFDDDAVFGDNRLPVVPAHVYRAELRLGSDALHVAPNVEWVPEGAWADYVNGVKTHGYALLGVTAGAKLTDNIDLFVDARNLTAKKAAGDLSAAIAANAGSAIYYPVERRAVSGGVRARF
jgi:iron complex outermembrane receptor protein